MSLNNCGEISGAFKRPDVYTVVGYFEGLSPDKSSVADYTKFIQDIQGYTGWTTIMF